MRELMLSIQPRWVEKIVCGKKTVEVRKTRPKCETPFKCYIYETKDKRFENMGYCWSQGKYFEHNIGKVIGEFVCDRIIDIPHKDLAENFRRLTHDIITPSCLKVQELKDYLGCKDGYGWHITELVVYDEPSELSEFEKPCEEFEFSTVYSPTIMKARGRPKFFERPPQSWCYIEPRQTAD